VWGFRGKSASAPNYVAESRSSPGQTTLALLTVAGQASGHCVRHSRHCAIWESAFSTASSHFPAFSLPKSNNTDLSATPTMLAIDNASGSRRHRLQEVRWVSLPFPNAACGGIKEPGARGPGGASWSTVSHNDDVTGNSGWVMESWPSRHVTPNGSRTVHQMTGRVPFPAFEK
jgi:hypothetical protein